MWILTLLLLVAPAPSAGPAEGEAGSAPERYIGNVAAIAAGRELYLSACSSCHGLSGTGGRGPNLMTSRGVVVASDQELFQIIRDGLPDMPSLPFPVEQVWQVTAYVRNLAAPALLQEISGDPEAGRALYYGKCGCSECHMIRGQGGYLGPDLTNVGLRLGVNALREAVFEPGKRNSDGFRPVIVVLEDGRRIRGSARNYSNYSLQVIDAEGRLYLLDTRDVQGVNFPQESWMPTDCARRFSDKEADDLIAFLSRQALGALE